MEKLDTMNLPFENVNIGICMVSPEGRFLNVNNTFCFWLGYSKEELLDLNFNDITHIEDINIGKSFLKQVISGEINNAVFEKRYVHKNGQAVWVNISISLQHHQESGFRYFISYVQNISSRKQAEEALKESGNRLQQIFNNIADGVFLLEVTEDYRFRNLEMNTSFLGLTGIDRNYMLGRFTEETVPEETANIVNAKYRRCVETELPIEEEAELDLPVGKRIFHSSLIPIRNETGRIYRIVGITHDITERKNIEKAFRYSQESLKQAQRIAHMGSWEHDIANNKTTWSDETYRILEVDKTSVSPSYDTLINLIHPEDRKKVIKGYAESYENHTTYRDDFRLLFPDGRIKFMHTRNKTVYDINGKPIRTLGILQSITERKTYEEKLKKSENQLRELNQMKDKFFSIIAHDLRSPFSAILGLVEILQSGFDNMDTKEIKKYLSLIYQSSRNHFNLLENLLEWARLQQKEIKIKKEDIQLNSIVNNIITLLHLNISQKKITVFSDISDNIHVLADANMLTFVLRNLIVNAIKFTPKNGEISISATENYDIVETTVSDTGTGIDKDDLKKLFRIDTRFSTVGTNQEKGSGMGLILCKEFVEKNGGKIWVESEPGKGSKFKFTILAQTLKKDQ